MIPTSMKAHIDASATSKITSSTIRPFHEIMILLFLIKDLILVLLQYRDESITDFWIWYINQCRKKKADNPKQTKKRNP